MRDILSRNILMYRKTQGLTQEALASRLNITYQAVSKWETGQTVPDTLLLPRLARALNVGVDKLLGYTAFNDDVSYYDGDYKKDEYFWGVQPSIMCLKIIELLPPVRPLKVLDVGCGEGKDAVFLARCGYDVSAFDISEAGIEKARRLADGARVNIHAFRANMWDYRLSGNYDAIFSSGALHYIKPDLRDEIIADYKSHINENGVAALHVFVEKPFITAPPEKEENAFHWRSGQLFTYFHAWYIEGCSEYVFDCNSSGIPHRHAANRLYAINTTVM